MTHLGSSTSLLIVHASKYVQKPVAVTKGANKFSSAHVVLAARAICTTAKASRLPATRVDPVGRSASHRASNQERCSSTVGMAHALVINSLSLSVTSDRFFRRSKGRHPLPIGKCPLGDSEA